MISSDKNLREKIIGDLLITGFPLEVYVSNTLVKAGGWSVTNSPLYIDPDDNVTRELDIRALKIYSEGSKDKVRNNISVFSHLIIQCKKSSKPWVFFDNAGDDYFWLGFYSLKCDKNDFMTSLCRKGDTIGFTTHRYKNIKRHKSFHVFSTKEKEGNKEIYEALITSCKALEYYKNMYLTGNTAHFFTPIVVLDGTLWSASLSKTSKIKLKQVKNLVVRFDYIFGDDKKPSKYTNQLIEDITRKDFKRRIKEIENDNNVLSKSWVNFINLQKPL